MAVALVFLLRRAGSCGCLGGAGRRRPDQHPCADIASLCGLENLLCSILTGLRVLGAREELLLPVVTNVHASAGHGPVAWFFEASVVLDVVPLVLEEFNYGVFGQIELR